jgi:dynein light chain roadblock-type
MSSVEETLRRIENNKSVIGTIVLDQESRVIHSMFKSGEPSRYADKLPPLIERASSLVRDLDATNDLTFLRIRAEKTEILISPGEDYTLVVVQAVQVAEG